MVRFMNQNSSTKNFSFITLGRITAVGLQAAFYLLFAALLDPAVYGQLNIIIALAMAFGGLSRFGLNQTLQVYRAKNNSKISEQINTLFLITTSIAALILVVIDIYAALLSLAVSFFLMNQYELLGFKRYKNYLLNSLLKNGLVLILPLLLYFVFEIPGIVLGMAIGNFIPSVRYIKRLKFQSIVDLKNYYKVIIHNFGVSAGNYFTFSLDKLLIGYLFGFFMVGVYQFNLQIFFGISVLGGVLQLYLLSEEASGESHRKLQYLVVLFSIVVAVLTVVLAPIFVNEFFPKYSEGILSLQILALATIPASLEGIFIAKLIARESTKIGYSALVRTGSILFLIATLGQFYGLMGLSLAVLLSTIIHTTFLSFLYLKIKK